jgi:internalin A
MSLDISFNQVGDEGAKILGTRLLSKDDLTKLETLTLDHNLIRTVPAEITEKYNCLPDLRHWFSDLGPNPEVNREVKLIFIGNGTVGKSTLLERLRSDTYTEKDSTHAIDLQSWEQHFKESDEYISFRAWDFGGQDIYHGTHRFFMRTRAVFILVWDRETEKKAEAGEKAIEIRNGKTLTFDLLTVQDWTDTIRSLSPESPILLVENKSDLRVDFQLKNIPGNAIQARISAQKPEPGQLDNLWASVLEASKSLRDFGQPIPPSWKAVQQAVFNGLEEKSIEWEITFKMFEDWCHQHRVPQSSHRSLLRFLHATGALFNADDRYEPQSRIILDQTKAIAAVYKVLERNGTIQRIMSKSGRVSTEDLDDMVWKDYAPEDRRLFLQFMIRCELCFAIPVAIGQEEYVIPQLLPEKPTDRLKHDIEKLKKSPCLFLRLEFDFLHKSIIERFLARTGKKADVDDYWKYGILFHKGDLEALVETIPGERLPVSGKRALYITISGKDSQSRQFLDAIQNEIFEILDRQPFESAVSLDGANWKSLSILKEYEEEGLLNDEARGQYHPYFESRDEKIRLENLLSDVKPEKPSLFICYAHEDKDLKNRFISSYLKISFPESKWDIWHDRDMNPGLWSPQIEHQIKKCRYFIILASENSIKADSYCFKQELPAIKKAGGKNIIPVVVDSCNWEKAVGTSDAYPYYPDKNGTLKPINEWPDQLAALKELTLQLELKIRS